MPYTPPSQTPSASPSSSRSSSFSNHDPHGRSPLRLFESNGGPPRSTSYLHRHRRSSSGTLPPFQPPVTQQPTAGRERSCSLPSATDVKVCNGSVRQSPPPVTNGLTAMPMGALISPPDSNPNSDEEDSGRGRDLGKLEAELKEAIKWIPQRRASPDGADRKATLLEVDTSRGRYGHSRSRSEPSALIDIATSRSRSGSNSGSVSDMEDDAYRIAPPMVRKKSGEVVKSSLKSPSRSRPCSVPSTPTFPKNVHFDSNMEHVRHFLHSEKPSAVSVGSSPVEGVYDAESEYPFGYDDEPQWEIGLPNFPKDHEARKSLPVRLEKVCLSTDKKNLIGTIAVANLSFQKSVVARFTFDYWQTVSEVNAEYSSDVRRREREEGVDRFVFKIKLAEQANLEKKILFFCIRYCAAGQEYWDNNRGVNFQVDFKKATPCRGAGPQLSALPRSRPHSASQSRPRSMPNLDQFDILNDELFSMKQDRKQRSKPKIVAVDEETELPSRRSNPTGNAFGSRYDFRTSLNAAIKASGTQQSRPERIPVLDLPIVAPPMESSSYFNLPLQNLKTGTLAAELASNTPLDTPSISGAGHPEVFSTENFWTNEDKPSIESPSYRELLDNYCFFGSSKATKQPTPKPEPKKQSTEKIKESLQFLLPTGKERPASPQYLASPVNGTSITPPSLSVAQQKTSGNASPIPLNYAGYHHRRRGSGAFRFDTTQQTPTAIC